MLAVILAITFLYYHSEFNPILNHLLNITLNDIFKYILKPIIKYIFKSILKYILNYNLNHILNYIHDHIPPSVTTISNLVTSCQLICCFALGTATTCRESSPYD